MILIDNYDSFTYNLVQYLQELGQNPIVFENDRINVSELKKMNFKKIIISPGAGSPDTAGISMDVIKQFHNTKEILGVCLGHQCIAQFFGGEIVKAETPVHGKTSQIFYEKPSIIFNNISPGFSATRYHSLVVKRETFPQELAITASTNDGIIMGLQHKHLPVYGVQFHPEAILTEYGKELLKNFIIANS